jgi:hypothetical protein
MATASAIASAAAPETPVKVIEKQPIRPSRLRLYSDGLEPSSSKPGEQLLQEPQPDVQPPPRDARRPQRSSALAIATASYRDIHGDDEDSDGSIPDSQPSDKDYEPDKEDQEQAMDDHLEDGGQLSHDDDILDGLIQDGILVRRENIIESTEGTDGDDERESKLIYNICIYLCSF